MFLTVHGWATPLPRFELPCSPSLQQSLPFGQLLKQAVAEWNELAEHPKPEKFDESVKETQARLAVIEAEAMLVHDSLGEWVRSVDSMLEQEPIEPDSVHEVIQQLFEILTHYESLEFPSSLAKIDFLKLALTTIEKTLLESAVDYDPSDFQAVRSTLQNMAQTIGIRILIELHSKEFRLLGLADLHALAVNGDAMPLIYPALEQWHQRLVTEALNGEGDSTAIFASLKNLSDGAQGNTHLPKNARAAIERMRERAYTAAPEALHEALLDFDEASSRTQKTQLLARDLGVYPEIASKIISLMIEFRSSPSSLRSLDASEALRYLEEFADPAETALEAILPSHYGLPLTQLKDVLSGPDFQGERLHAWALALVNLRYRIDLLLAQHGVSPQALEAKERLTRFL